MATSDIVGAARAVAQPGAFLLGGGDPIQRADLLELVAELARLRPAGLGLCTAGAGVTTAVADRLRLAGVERVHIPFHCARQDAHDWLVGRPGALKVAHRAILACLDVGLSVTAEVMLTRPTMPQLAETIEVLSRLGVGSVCLRRLTAQDTNGPEFVPLAPRLALLGEHLERAAAAALARRLRVLLRDLPVCIAPRLAPLFAPPDSEGWVMPDGSVQQRSEAKLGCETCPGPPRCAGAPADYVARFGWEEFVDPRVAAPRVAETVEEQQSPTPTPIMAFSWRGPRRVRCETCAETVGEPARPAQPYESTRVVRARLVEAARYRPALVRLVGGTLLAHPEGAGLIYDALRLFPRVEVAGEASAVVDWSDLDLRRLKGLQRFDVALFGPDAAAHDAHCGIPGAFAATLRGVERLRGETPIAIGAYAIVHDARWIAAFAEAWSRGALPGGPRFRLSPHGGSLDALIESAQALPPGAARSALVAVLPRCMAERAGLAIGPAGDGRVAAQQTIHSGRSLAYHPCGSDPLGAFDPCPEGSEACAANRCPGTAVGWQATARSQRWSTSI